MKFLIFSLVSGLLMACGASSSDPSTSSRDDLAPPSGLESITGSASVKLIWQGFNSEDEFRGYQVFGAELKDDMNLPSLVAYPRKPADMAQLVRMAIPRCADNSKFFEAFGFKNTETKCEKATEEEMASALVGSSLTSVVEETEKEDKNAPLRNRLVCSGQENDDFVSLKVANKADGLKQHSCTVSALKNASGEDIALENGKKYIFFAVSVAGDKYNQISWTSNAVIDVPALTIFNESITLAASKFVRFPIASTEAITAPTAADCVAGACALATPNELADFGLYLGRDSGTNKDRLFISAPKFAGEQNTNGQISIVSHGPATVGDYQVYLPKDQANEAGYDQSGVKFTLTGDNIFDFKVKLASGIHYGKIAVTDRSFASDALDADMTLRVTIVLQPAPLTPYYFR